jgi:predicted transcriptional regulator
VDHQITLRLPADLDRRLSRQAHARGVKKSQLVREAVSRYLEQAEGDSPEQQWRRIEPLIGSLDGDAGRLKRDPLAWQMYRNNFRD